MTTWLSDSVEYFLDGGDFIDIHLAMNPKHATNGLMCMVLIIVTSENLCDAMSHKEKRYLR